MRNKQTIIMAAIAGLAILIIAIANYKLAFFLVVTVLMFGLFAFLFDQMSNPINRMFANMRNSLSTGGPRDESSDIVPNIELARADDPARDDGAITEVDSSTERAPVPPMSNLEQITSPSENQEDADPLGSILDSIDNQEALVAGEAISESLREPGQVSAMDETPSLENSSEVIPQPSDEPSFDIDKLGGIAFDVARHASHVTGISVDGTVVKVAMRSTSATPAWTFSIDFDDGGRVTGRYDIKSENDESDIPELFASLMSERIRACAHT